MKNTLIILTHPDLRKSRINRALFDAVKNKPNITISGLYEKYPDFNIDIAAEQALLLNADAVIFQFPFYWYSTPPLLKLWMDKILLPGFAYGENGDKLSGKILLAAVSADGSFEGYQPTGHNLHTIEELLNPVKLTANYCKMKYLNPFVIYNTDNVTNEELKAHVLKYGELIDLLQGEEMMAKLG